jgi:anti-sigma factor RsiW
LRNAEREERGLPSKYAVSQAALADVMGVSSSAVVCWDCDAWGSRIETTLLADLSEEERRGLAEHVQSCSACAERFRRYQAIEEFAGELPLYDLLGWRDVGLSSSRTKRGRLRFRGRVSWSWMGRGRRRRAFAGLMVVFCLAFFLAPIVRGSMALLVALFGLVTLALVPVVYERLR